MSHIDPMQMAYFRFGLISPLLPISETEKLKDKIQQQAEKIWTTPGGRLRKFAFSTIEAWYYGYKKGGIEALKDKPRDDKGTYRVIGDELISEIDDILTKHPALSTANIIELLDDKNLLNSEAAPSTTTLYRYVQQQRPIANKTPVRERRAFEAPHSASLWQTDVMYGPYLSVKGSDGRYRKKQTFLVAIIDDHSRLCCHGEFYFDQTLGAVIDTLKKACQKRGIPERLYCDHGQVFTSGQLSRVGALIGAVILHPGVGDPAPRGKIERFFKTVQDNFLNKLIHLDPPKTLAQLNEKFAAWGETSYNNKHHSAIGQSPMQKWLISAHHVRLLPIHEDIDLAFMLEVQRKVKKDGTFSLHSRLFETDCALARKKIRVRYNPFYLDRAYVYFENEFFGRAHPLSKSDNNNRPRNK